MMKLWIITISLSLLAVATVNAADAGDSSAKSPAGMTEAQPKADVEWVYVGCAAYPVTAKAEADDVAMPQQSTSRIDLASQSFTPQDEPD